MVRTMAPPFPTVFSTPLSLLIYCRHADSFCMTCVWVCACDKIEHCIKKSTFWLAVYFIWPWNPLWNSQSQQICLPEMLLLCLHACMFFFLPPNYFYVVVGKCFGEWCCVMRYCRIVHHSVLFFSSASVLDRGSSLEGTDRPRPCSLCAA